MTKKKTYKLGSEELLKLLIDKQLAKYKVTYEDVKKRKDAWYSEYTFDTEKEYLDWKQFCLDVLTKQVSPKLTKGVIEQNFNYVDLCWGLRHTFDTSIKRSKKETIIA